MSRMVKARDWVSVAITLTLFMGFVVLVELIDWKDALGRYSRCLE